MRHDSLDAPKPAHLVAIGVIAVAVLIFDQSSKRAVITHVFFDGQCIPWCGHKDLIAGWLRVAPEPNYHGAFGLLGSNTPLLILMALVVLVIFWVTFSQPAGRSLLVRIAFGLILGGAVSNVIDRVHYGYVVDFIDFYRFPDVWHYTFNIADSCITVGVVLLLISGVTARRHA